MILGKFSIFLTKIKGKLWERFLGEDKKFCEENIVVNK
jgi:hypothetical protein